MMLALLLILKTNDIFFKDQGTGAVFAE